jgi:hypothetical protein
MVGRQGKGRVAIFVILIVVIMLLLGYFLIVPYKVNHDKLTLRIKAATATMDINGSVDLTILLTNNGRTPVNVLRYHGIDVEVLHPNGTMVHWDGPMESMALPSNDDVHSLGPGQSFSYDSRLSSKYWALEENVTFGVHATYHAPKYSTVTLPYWTGELVSNRISVTVT